MDGYILYRQYLDSVCNSVKSYDVPRTRMKNIIDILFVSKEIEDLGYLDEIFENAGEDISYLGNKDFILKPVKVVSKLEKMVDMSFLDPEIQETMTGMFRDAVDIEEDSIDELNTFLESLNNVSDEKLGSNSFLGDFSVVDGATLIQTEKDSLASLFSTLNLLNETVEEVKEEEKRKQESHAETPHRKQFRVGYKEDEEVDLFDDSDFEDIEDLDDNNDNIVLLDIDDEVNEADEVDEVNEVNEVNEADEVDEVNEVDEVDEGDETDESIDGLQNSVNDNIDASEIEELEKTNVDSSEYEQFSLNFSQMKNMEGIDDDLLDEDLEKKDFSKFIDDDLEDEEPAFLDKFKSNDNTLPEYDDGCIEDEEEMSAQLNAELSDSTPKYEEDSFIDSELDSATDYFMTKSAKSKEMSQNIESLKAAYKSKEKLKNSPDIEQIDDSLAKVLLAMGVAFMSLPAATAKLMEKLKGSGEKLKDAMIVGEDEDEDE